jgi:putative sigma-54 modulation protein
LEQFYDRIIDTKILLKLENSGQVREKIVELKLNVPGDTLVASETSMSFEGSVDVVVDNMKRQLIKYKERLRMRP